MFFSAYTSSNAPSPMRPSVSGNVTVSISPQPENAPIPTEVTPLSTTSFRTAPRSAYHGASPAAKSVISPSPNTVSTPSSVSVQLTDSPHTPSAIAMGAKSASSITAAHIVPISLFFIMTSHLRNFLIKYIIQINALQEKNNSTSEDVELLS